MVCKCPHCSESLSSLSWRSKELNVRISGAWRSLVSCSGSWWERGPAAADASARFPTSLSERPVKAVVPLHAKVDH